MIVYLARDIPQFVMYCVNGKPRSSLFIESTDSMIILADSRYRNIKVGIIIIIMSPSHGNTFLQAMVISFQKTTQDIKHVYYFINN